MPFTEEEKTFITELDESLHTVRVREALAALLAFPCIPGSVVVLLHILNQTKEHVPLYDSLSFICAAALIGLAIHYEEVISKLETQKKELEDRYAWESMAISSKQITEHEESEPDKSKAEELTALEIRSDIIYG